MIPIREMINEPLYAWIAPDGEVQLTLIGPDPMSVMAMTDVLASQTVGKNSNALKEKGYEIQPILLTITSPPFEVV